MKIFPVTYLPNKTSFGKREIRGETLYISGKETTIFDEGNFNSIVVEENSQINSIKTSLPLKLLRGSNIVSINSTNNVELEENVKIDEKLEAKKVHSTSKSSLSAPSKIGVITAEIIKLNNSQIGSIKIKPPKLDHKKFTSVELKNVEVKENISATSSQVILDHSKANSVSCKSFIGINSDIKNNLDAFNSHIEGGGYNKVNIYSQGQTFLTLSDSPKTEYDSYLAKTSIKAICASGSIYLKNCDIGTLISDNTEIKGELNSEPLFFSQIISHKDLRLTNTNVDEINCAQNIFALNSKINTIRSKGDVELFNSPKPNGIYTTGKIFSYNDFDFDTKNDGTFWKILYKLATIFSINDDNKDKELKTLDSLLKRYNSLSQSQDTSFRTHGLSSKI